MTPVSFMKHNKLKKIQTTEQDTRKDNRKDLLQDTHELFYYIDDYNLASLDIYR